jgi:flagellar biosynthetic protein FlhB
MSETEDRESKTEEATEKKIRDAVEQGNVPSSREVPVLISLLSILAVCAGLVPARTSDLTLMMANVLAGAGDLRLQNQAEASAVLFPLLADVSWRILPILLVLMAGGVASALIQNPFQLNLQRIIPKASRISPRQGWSRLFGMRGAADFAKSLFKFIAIAIIVFAVFKANYDAVVAMMLRPPQLIAQLTLSLAMKLLGAIAVAALGLAAVDMLWSRISWRRDLRMTKQEVKEEHRQAEGDPMIKLRAKALARQRSSRRMMAALPKATMVIANPTHYAVAMRYERSEGGAPIVLAKGRDELALKIRGRAEELGIAVIENKPLARALYDKAEINATIPPEFFKAVAEIVHFLHMRKVARLARPHS